MKSGRDWSYWNNFILEDSMSYIGKNIKRGMPFPISYKNIGWNLFRMKGSPIFTIKAWGNGGYK